MSFTVQDFTDLVRLLTEHPEWRPELRRLVLTEELLTLPDLMREILESHRLAELRLTGVEGRLLSVEELQVELKERQTALEVRQTKLEERLTALEERQSALEERQKKLEERMAALEGRMQLVEERLAKLEERMQLVEERLAKLEVRMRIVEERLNEVISRLSTVETRLESNTREINRLAGEFGNFKGRMLETTMQLTPAQILGTAFKAVRNVGRANLPEAVETALTKDDLREVNRLDALMSVQSKEFPEYGEIWLAIEISGTIDESDVDRAKRRAAILKTAGFPAVPLVIGYSLRADGDLASEQQAVMTLVDFEFDRVAEALARHLGSAR